MPAVRQALPEHDTSIKRWRHLNFFQYECLLEARVPRSNCPEHGVLSVAVPGRGRQRFYASFRGPGDAVVPGDADGGGG